MAKLFRRGRTERRPLEKPDGVQEETEGDLWEDLDGNVHAWTPKGSGVISIEIWGGNEETAETVYKRLRGSEGQVTSKTIEEELAELKEAFAKVCRRLAELER